MVSSHFKNHPTASILIIGNEILSGKTEDSNSKFLCLELRKLGVTVSKVTILQDLEDEIAREIEQASKQFSWVFTCGGVGPTHDDVTIKGIAKGLSRGLFPHPDLLQILHERYGNSLNMAQQKLAQVPEGTVLIFGENGKFPVLNLENIFILPGVPIIMQKKFTLIKSRFQSMPFSIKRIFVNAYEEEIAHILDQLVEEFPELLLGSYPHLNQENYKVLLTLESKDHNLLNKSFHKLINILPANFIYKSE
ncbi:MAG TPA: competence/damage-inducible protein A [Nitrospiria bacterium]|jgi:FAD synthetase